MLILVPARESGVPALLHNVHYPPKLLKLRRANFSAKSCLSSLPYLRLRAKEYYKWARIAPVAQWECFWSRCTSHLASKECHVADPWPRSSRNNAILLPFTTGPSSSSTSVRGTLVRGSSTPPFPNPTTAFSFLTEVRGTKLRFGHAAHVNTSFRTGVSPEFPLCQD